MESWRRISRALPAGAAVAAIGLPQILAVGALSLTPLGPQALAAGVVSAFIAAIAGGFCAALISRTPGEVSAPLVSIGLVYAALCADIVLTSGPGLAPGEVIATLSLAVVLMGVLQLLAGWARLGEALKFIPYPVNAGLVTGTGLLVVWAQLGPMIGLDGRLTNYDWTGLFDRMKPLALLIGITSAATVWLIPLLIKRAQPRLAGLLAGALLFQLVMLVAEPNAAGPTVGAISPLAIAYERVADVWSPIDPFWLAEKTVQVLPYAALLALEGTMELAVTSRDVAEVTGARPDIHRGLLAQGAANVLSGALAGLPIAPSHAESLAAARRSDVRVSVPYAVPVVLLLVVVAFGGLAFYVPVAVLAGLLVTVGVGLVDRWTRGLVRRAVRGGESQGDILWNLAIVVAVAASLFFGGVPLALLVGTVLAMVMLAHILSAATTFIPEDGRHFASTRVWPPEQAQWLSPARGVIRVLRPSGGLFFGTAEQLAAQLSALDKPVRYCIIDCSRLTVLDATGCQIVAASARRLAARGITTLLAGLHPSNPHDHSLIELGLDTPAPAEHWFRDLDHALEWVEAELLREHWPDVAADQPVELTESQLARGLQRAEQDMLSSHLKPADFDAGAVLFERGTPGAALYVIARGLVEIRVNSDTANRTTRRLAVFGPGSIFGETAMLTGGPRTADAVCLTPTRLYELRQESLRELEDRFPAVYANIIENLTLHLAKRLMATTEIARGN